MDRLRDADTTLVVPNPFDIPPPGTINDKPGFFIDCDLEAGFLGTPFRAYWANMITECIRNAILKAGITPEYTDWHQLGLAIEKIAERIATLLIEQALNDLEFVQDGGNVTGTIKNKKFTLNAPVAPPLPATLVQEGGNVSGTISIADGTFTLNAESEGGGGGGEGPAIQDRVVVIGSGTSVRGATDAGSVATWTASGLLGVHNGSIGASGGSGGSCIVGGTLIDGSQPINFSDCAGLAISQPAIAGKNWIKCTTDVANLQFRVGLDGAVTGASFTSPAADYAEWFEGLEPLPVGGCVVIGDGGLIRLYDSRYDRLDDIMGVVRPRKTRDCLIGNAAEHNWAGMYLKDEFGDPVYENWTDPADGSVHRVLAVNPAYEASLPYLPRSARPEWNLIGLLGQVPILNGQPQNPRWRAMRPISDHVTLVYIR